DLQSAYALPSATAGGGRTVAIVDAMDDPNAEADLAVYRSQFGLPPCTTANGCFRKVDQNGGTAFPRRNISWAEEISLDVDMVSAAWPNCKILLVEASSASLANLPAAVDTAARLGANRRGAAVSAVADPNSGVAVYDSFKVGGWLVFGGTSVSSPLVASVFALAGNAAGTVSQSYPYSHASSMHDVTSGSNGVCGGSYLCTAGAGYDGPTGLGTPNAETGF